MLTPEYLNLIEFNDVVELYNKLNVEITADIIKRISAMNEITSTTKKQLKILLETNGTEVFNEALNKTSMLTADTKKALKELFADVAKEDMQGYEELYQYRGKPFKLSKTQYMILNQGLKQTNRVLKNLTNTIAFQSKKAYVETIDEAYMQVVTGAFDYTTAINTAVQKLANKGITLKDKAGRNVQLEVAVRRNVMSGIRETANNMNRNIEEELGCDGRVVSAHIGARPTHAEAQGKQYAYKHDTKISKQYPLWSSVESLWKEYNCGHESQGIILGISEPIYTEKELEEFKNAKVMLNGEEVPYYEATQKQRALENQIRKAKRSVETLEKAGQDSTIQRSKLTQLNKKYTSLCNETGLAKDYGRIKVAKISTNRKNGSIIGKDIPTFDKKILNQKDTIHSKKELKNIAKETFEIANKYTTNKSKWKGKIIVSNRHVSAKLWNCKIEIENIATGHEVLHEQLHAHSISYFDRETYKKYRRIEEATVELYTKEICKKENIVNVKSEYDEWVNNLRKINSKLKIENNDFDFAKRLFEIPVTKRIEFLDDEIQKYIQNKSIGEIMEISKLIEVFYGK